MDAPCEREPSSSTLKSVFRPHALRGVGDASASVPSRDGTREEEAWERARQGLRELGELLEENGEGPFFMGGVCEFLFSLRGCEAREGKWRS
jgi:hypothetical protein